MKITTRIPARSVLPLLLAVLAFAGASASAQSDEVLTLDIEPQAAGSALMKLAESSGAQILLAGGEHAHVEVEGLQGEYQLEEALTALLADTGLAYEFTSENVVLVQETEEDAEPEQEAEEADDDSAVEEEEDPMELAPQTVTGSRLLGGDPSSRLFSFTAEDIAQRGVSTVEEFFRKLPFAFASLTTQTGAEAGGVFGQLRGEEISLSVSGVGASSINLRGLGVANTLVLLNGRRVAGTGGMEDDFANLLNVPLSAIERVDIQLDGASAVYGSDAIGGVVNFITKKNYSGLSLTYRHEFSATDADKTNATITGGYAWGSGNMSVIMDRATSEPINNEKTGWTSRDLRPYLGVEFDNRTSSRSQPGIVCFPRKRVLSSRPPLWSCRDRTRYQLPHDHSGADATVDDFLTFSRSETAPTPLDEIDPHNGADYTTSSVSLNVEQYLTGDLLVYANALYSLNESYQDRSSFVSDSFLVPASNAYNPFGQTVIVNYAAVHERDNGLLPAQREGSENESRTLAAGVVWSIGDDHVVEVSANRTKSWREAYDLRIKIRDRSVTDPTARAFYEALSSPDSARAINPFGNGMAQGSAFEDLLTNHSGPYFGTNETRQYNALLRGRLFRMWGGAITYSLGGEMREFINYYSHHDTYTRNWEGIDEPYVELSGSFRSSSVARQSRETEAYYAELALPFFGPDNARPGLHSLILTLQARYDVDVVVGADGVGGGRLVPVRWHYWDPEEGFTFLLYERAFQSEPSAELVKVRNGDLTPRVGINYKPVPTLTLRASWRRSYKSPNWGNLFSRARTRVDGVPYGYSPYGEEVIIDLFDPDGPRTLTRDQGVTFIRDWSPVDLEPQYSDSWSVGFDWTPDAIPGLRWRVDWSKTDYTNRITSNSEYLFSNPAWILAHPQTGIRNERGDLVTVYYRDINMAADYNELITTELEYTFDTRFGEFTPRIHYSRYLDDFYQIHVELPQVRTMGTQNGMDEYQLQGSLTWLWDRFSADVYLYYRPKNVHDRARYCSLSTINLPGSRCTPELQNQYLSLPVSSLTTVDLTMTYQFDNGLRLRFGGTNHPRPCSAAHGLG